MKNKISVIIPSYYEEYFTIDTVKNLLSISKDIELIIVYKGEKYDLLKEKLDELGGDINIFEYLDKSSRAKFMNFGAEKSSGDILLFLHNDTILPQSYFTTLSNLDLRRNNYGGFYKQFYPNNSILRLNNILTNIRLTLFGSLLGDNSIFVSKDLFFRISGFPEIDLMEDVEFSKLLKQNGSIKIIRDKSITSSRKFQKSGTFKTLFFMSYMRFLHWRGTPSHILKEKYNKI